MRLGHNYCIQEGNGPTWFCILCFKLDVWVHVVNVLQELLVFAESMTTKVYSAVLMALISKFSIQRLDTVGLMGDVTATPWSFFK